MTTVSILTITAGTLAGAFAGGTIALWFSRPTRPAHPKPPTRSSEIDGAQAQRIDDAARAWAKAHGQPAAAPLVANKLRLDVRLSDRRTRY
jgi:hypothetical protein